MGLTKKLTFDDNVLDVVRGMEWQPHGHGMSATITRQLDRTLYLKVKKAIEAMGGKWVRKEQAHIFPTDPRPQVEGLLENGELTVTRDGYFPTPYSIGTKMARLAELEPGCVVLEPSAGTGELAQAILEIEPTAQVVCGEKDAQRVEVLKSKGLDARQWDFLEYDGRHKYIIQNPPFEELQDIDHVLHAYECLVPGGVLVSVISESPFFRTDEKAEVFRRWLADMQHQVVDLERGAFSESGTGVKARIVVIKKPKPGAYYTRLSIYDGVRRHRVQRTKVRRGLGVDIGHPHSAALDVLERE